MNKKETIKAIEVMQAYVDGEDVGYEAVCGLATKRLPSDSRPRLYEAVCGLATASEPSWNWRDNVYLIKPKPLVLWVNVYPDGELFYHKSKETAKVGRVVNAKTIKMVEAKDECTRRI